MRGYPPLEDAVSHPLRVVLVLLLLNGVAHAGQAAPSVSLLDVPYISQSEDLCGGAAAAMVLRYWGERGVDAESFEPLLDRSAAGIRTDALTAELERRGWQTAAVGGDPALVAGELQRGRPVLALIQDRPGRYHYVVIVAWQDRGVIFHDPARAPFRVMPRADFESRWRAAGAWMLIVVPGASRTSMMRDDAEASASVLAPTGDRCTALIASGVQAAQANDLSGAERSLTEALACPGGAALRELAGVRLLQRRWPEVTELAAAAVAQDPDDTYGWRLLGTGRFLEDDRVGALRAWNRAGQPDVDLVQFDGLTHTRHRVVEELVGVDRGDRLTPESFERSRRRLTELPSAASTRLTYVPAGSGLVELRGAVAERPLLPHSPIDLAAAGATAAVAREVGVSLGSLTGGGERITLAWRFWPGRPRIGVDATAPAPWGGTWAIDADAERQPFDRAGIARTERRTARVTVANWVTGRLRLQAGGGIEARDGDRRLGVVDGTGTFVTPADRLEAGASIGGRLGDGGFTLGRVDLSGWSRREPRGTVVMVRGTLRTVSRASPLDLWGAGDTGHARDTLLRAHPVLDAGRLVVERLGRTLVSTTFEAQRWRPVAIANVAAAIFIDTARTMQRLDAAAITDVDLGIGARLTVPLMPGMFRLDLAHGLRDGDTALSVAYSP